jgi:hypothetical protein
MTLDEAIVALIDEFSIGDSIYEVRERSLNDREWYQANPHATSWDHPKVTRFSEAVSTLEEHAKRNK